MVYRIFVEKKPGLRQEAAALLNDARSLLGVRGLENVRVEQYGPGLGLLIGRKAENEDLRCAAEGYRRIWEALTCGAYDVVIADEIHCAMAAGLLNEEQLLALADARPASVELVFTGRGATYAILERADLVTEMRPVKHYYDDKKLPARTGIEM